MSIANIMFTSLGKSRRNFPTSRIANIENGRRRQPRSPSKNQDIPPHPSFAGPLRNRTQPPTSKIPLTPPGNHRSNSDNPRQRTAKQAVSYRSTLPLPRRPVHSVPMVPHRPHRTRSKLLVPSNSFDFDNEVEVLRETSEAAAKAEGARDPNRLPDVWAVDHYVGAAADGSRCEPWWKFGLISSWGCAPDLDCSFGVRLSQRRAVACRWCCWFEKVAAGEDIDEHTARECASVAH